MRLMDCGVGAAGLVAVGAGAGLLGLALLAVLVALIIRDRRNRLTPERAREIAKQLLAEEE